MPSGAWNLTTSNNTTGGISVIGGQYASLNLSTTGGGNIVLTTTPTVTGSANLTTVGSGDILGGLDVGTTLTLNSSGNVGVDASDRFVTNASVINLSCSQFCISGSALVHYWRSLGDTMCWCRRNTRYQRCQFSNSDW